MEIDASSSNSAYQNEDGLCTLKNVRERAYSCTVYDIAQPSIQKQPIDIRIKKSLKQSDITLSFDTTSCNIPDKSKELTIKSTEINYIQQSSRILVGTYLIEFSPTDYDDLQKFCTQSQFHKRTDDASAQQYFQFYAFLSQQQNMMQDFVRTGTYQQAMLQNAETFKDKVVLDCGAGSAILSFFAMQAGAKKSVCS